MKGNILTLNFIYARFLFYLEFNEQYHILWLLFFSFLDSKDIGNVLT